MPFHQTRMELDIWLVLFQLLNFLANFEEKIRNWLGRIAPHSVQERVPWFRIQFHRSQTGSVLAPVVLLFHQEVQLVQAVGYRTVLLKIVGEWLTQTNIG